MEYLIFAFGLFAVVLALGNWDCFMKPLVEQSPLGMVSPRLGRAVFRVFLAGGGTFMCVVIGIYLVKFAGKPYPPAAASRSAAHRPDGTR